MSFTFPKDLINMSGAQQGAVKILFNEQSGQDKFLEETKLIKKLKKWIKDFCSKLTENQPRVIILVGGPGNGKTQSINQLLLYLFKLYDFELPNELQIHGSNGDRSFIIDTKKYKQQEHLKDVVLKIVQDGSVKEKQEKSSLAESLIHELEWISNKPSNYAYICCLNKGILNEAITLLDSTSHNTSLKQEIEIIIKASSVNYNNLPC